MSAWPSFRMNTMAKQPDWGKRGVIAAWVIGVPSFLLALLAYIRPADPAHPMQFDFIYNRVSISLPWWFLILLAMAAIAGIVLLVRVWRKKVPPSPVPGSLRDPTPARESAKSAESASSTSSVSDTGELILTTPEDIAVKITPNEWQHMKGYVISVVNHRLGAIGRVKLTVYSAQSFDERHNDYRDGQDFTAFAKVAADPIDASHTGKAMWFVRKDRGDIILVGDDSDHPLRWPDADKSTMQRWRLTIAIDAQTAPMDSSHSPTPLKQLKASVIVTWNTEKNRFSIASEENDRHDGNAHEAAGAKAVVATDPRLSISVIEDAKHGVFRSGAAITLKNVGGSEAQQITLNELTIGSHKVAFLANIPVLNAEDSTPPISGRVLDYGVLQQHDIATAMLDA